MIKKQIRVLGIDDSPFDKDKDSKVLVIGTLFRGGDFLDGVLSCDVMVDGEDSTTNISNMICQSKFKSQIQAVMLDGIAVAGFNIIDICKLHDETNIPVLVIMRNYPNLKKINAALDKINGAEKKVLLNKAGKIHTYNNIYFQVQGTDIKTAKDILKITITHSDIPECIRVAHLIASGIAFGESKGKA